MASSNHRKVSSSRKDLLISAISSNDLELLEKFLEQGADVDTKWPFEHHSIFTKAVENGNVDIIRCLIRNKARLKGNTLYNIYSPLVIAIRSNCSLPIVQLLVDSGADVDETDISGRTPLVEAITLNKEAVVDYLLMNGADVNQADGSGRLPVQEAVKNNRLEIVKSLTSRGAHIHRCDSRGEDALTLAQRLTDFSILNYLETVSQRRLQRNDTTRWEIVNGTIEEPETISFVIDSRSSSFVDNHTEPRIIRQSRNNSKYEANISFVINSKSGSFVDNHTEPRIITQSRNNSKYEDEGESVIGDTIEDDLERVELFLQNNNINDLDHDGFTPLAKAISLEKTQVVSHLLSLKADTCKMINGKTPLLLAVQKGNLEIIKLLVENGAEHTSQTAFFEAINLENLKIIKFFIETGVELNVVYKSGYTPLTKSLELKNFEVVKMLVDNGADVNMPDGAGKTPLTISLEEGDSEFVSLLFDKATSKTVRSLLYKYIEDGNLKIVKILVDVLNRDLDFSFDCGSSPLTKSVDLENFELVKYFLTESTVNAVDGNNRTPLGIAAKRQNLPLVKLLLSSGAAKTFASGEIEEFASICEDFALYLDIEQRKHPMRNAESY